MFFYKMSETSRNRRKGTSCSSNTTELIDPDDSFSLKCCCRIVGLLFSFVGLVFSIPMLVYITYSFPTRVLENLLLFIVWIVTLLWSIFGRVTVSIVFIVIVAFVIGLVVISFILCMEMGWDKYWFNRKKKKKRQ